MGKGTGNCVSGTNQVTQPQSQGKSEATQPATNNTPPETQPVKKETPQPVPQPVAKPTAASNSVPNSSANPATATKKMAKIWIVFYSMYGHVQKMAEAIKEGIDSIEGCEGILYQVPETLSEDVLSKMHAPPKSDIPFVDVSKMPEADGFIFGMPSRFGMMAAQMKSFFDMTGQHWQSGALVGKPAGLFVSTGTQGGGQETVAFTAVTQLAHHGMVFVPAGYSAGPVLFNVEEVRGGSPWGSGCMAGPTGARQPSATELEIAKSQGKTFAAVAKKLAAK